MADATPGGGNGVDPEKEQAEQSAKRILEEGAASDAPAMPEALRFLTEKAQLQEIELKKEYATQEIELREAYAKGLLAILAVELVVVNVIFWFYAEKGKNWNIPDGVVQIWLGATVVQIVGVVTVVTRYLFPNRDSQPEPPPLPTPSS
jgi:hypothetical protein